MQTWHKLATAVGGPLLATTITTGALAQDTVGQIANDTKNLYLTAAETHLELGVPCGYVLAGFQTNGAITACLNAIDATDVNDAAVDVLRVRIGAVNGSAKQEPVFSAPSTTTASLDLRALSALSPQVDVQTIINLGEECSADYIAANGNAACLASTRAETLRYYEENIRPFYVWHRDLLVDRDIRAGGDGASSPAQQAQGFIFSSDSLCREDMAIGVANVDRIEACLVSMWNVANASAVATAQLSPRALRIYANTHPGVVPQATLQNYSQVDTTQDKQWNAIAVTQAFMDHGNNASQLSPQDRILFQQMEAVREELKTVESAPKSQLDALPRINPEKESQILDRGSDDPNLDNMDRLANDVVAYYKDARAVLRQNEFANMSAIFAVEEACVQADLDLNTQIYGRDDVEKVFLLSQCLVAVVNNLPGYQPERMEFLRQRLKAMNSGTPMMMDPSAADSQPGLRAD